MITRYEYSEGSSDKFYEIEWHKPSKSEATIRYGRIGQAGTIIIYDLATARKKEAEKLKKGYKQKVVASAVQPVVQPMKIVMSGSFRGITFSGLGSSTTETKQERVIPAIGQVWKQKGYDSPAYIRIIARGAYAEQAYTIVKSKDGKSWGGLTGDEFNSDYINDYYTLVGS